MARITDRLVERGREAARAVADEVETRILVAEGRKAVKQKVRTVRTVSKKAMKTGLVVGTLAAATVVAREIRKRRG